MQIKLKNLTLTNFKGVKNLEVLFNHITNIFGDNATGKTSLFDAFLWLFFGKNSQDLSQFEIKRWDENGKFIKDLEAEVSAILLVDNQEIAVKKVLRQKWVKRRGELTSNYNGDENAYFWNDVPMKEGEFKAKIKGIVEEMLFKLITNPFYFNSLKWQERRNILIEIAGTITNDEIFDSIITVANKGQFNALIGALNQKKTVDEFKAEIAAKKKKIKDEAEMIPSRIDEVRRGMPEDKNYESIRNNVKQLTEKLTGIQTTLNDESLLQQEESNMRTQAIKSYNEQVQDRQRKIFDYKTKMQNIEFEVKQQARETGGKISAEITSLTRQVSDKKLDKERYASSLTTFEKEITSKETEVETLRDAYAKLNSEELEFNNEDFVCPSCQQALPTENIEAKKEELRTNFNTRKKTELEKIQSKASIIKSEIEALRARVSNGKTTIEQIEKELKVFEEKLGALQIQQSNQQSVEMITTGLLKEHADYQQLHSSLEATEAIKLTEPVFEPLQVNNQLKADRDEISNQIATLNKELASEEQRKKAEERIKELEGQESKLAQELVTLEGIEFSILQFTKAKVDAIERRINSKFQYVRFKMFNQQVNGGETECCDTLVNSNGSFVPFQDANNAAKINSGIDIINTLCKHYDVYAPIFIDNRESVTELIESESQIVNLFVVKGALLSVDEVKMNPAEKKPSLAAA